MRNLRNADRSQYIRAIYSPSQPCPPTYFAGRKSHLEFYKRTVLVPKLENLPPQPTNAAFLGGWGIGKTSLLTYLRELPTHEGFLKADVVKDFGSVEELLSQSLAKIASSISRWERLKTALSKLRGIGVSEFGVEFREERPRLEDALARTWSVLEEHGVAHCSILIDDLEQVGEGERKILRDIFQGLAQEGCNYSLVISCNPSVFEAPAMEPVTRFFEKRELEPFDRGEVWEALNRPLEYLREMEVKLDLSFEEGYADRLLEWTKGYPYFVKFVTRELALKYKKVRANQLEEHRAELVEAMGREKFRRDFESAGERGQQILTRMAKTGEEEFRASQFKDIPHYQSYLNLLKDRGLLLRSRRGVYSPYHPLFLEWIRRFGKKTA